MYNDKNDILERLRRKAENLVFTHDGTTAENSSDEIKRLFYELQIHQIELEMQNDELRLGLEELEVERNKFSVLFESAPIGYVVVTPEGIISDINYTGLQLLEKTKPAIHGKPFTAYIDAADINTFYTFLRKLAWNTERQSCILKLKKSSSFFMASIEGVGHTDSINTKRKCYLTITDITERYEIEQELKQANTRLELALNASYTGIWEINISDGKVLLDDFCYDLFGFTPGYFDGRFDSILQLIHPDDSENIARELRIALSRETNFNVEFRLMNPGQYTNYVLAKGHVVHDKEGQLRFVATFTNITERKILEQETASLKEQQQREITTATLQAEENLRRRISESLHDGVSQMLYAIKLNLEQTKSYEEATRKQIGHLLSQTIREVRNISFELAPAILVDFGLPGTLREMAQRLSGDQLSIITNISNIDKNLPLTVQTNIFRIVQELVNNSIIHGHATKIKIELNKNKNDDQIVILVMDNGSGFDADKESRLTNGSGLSSIRNRLSLYDGTLNIESAPEKGTTILIHIFLKSTVDPFTFIHEQQY
jgi:signal transduction histidine kinase